MSEAVLRAAASMLADDRKGMKERRLSAPGQAEYLDLLRAVNEQTAPEEDTHQQVTGKVEKTQLEKAQLALLDRVAVFALRKHPEVIPPPRRPSAEAWSPR